MSAHSTHCCKIHGCKYGDDNCPVYNGDEKGIICEDCIDDYQNPDKAEIVKLKQQRDELIAALKEYMRAGIGNSTDFAVQLSAYDLAIKAIAKAEA